MSEEPKNIRLNKAAKEFNVGITTLVEYLAKKGHQVDSSPNAKITPEQYALLSTAFQSERQVKENADRIEINAASNVVIEATKNSNDDENKDYGDEVIIKNFNTPKIKEVSKTEKATAEKAEVSNVKEPADSEVPETPKQAEETAPQEEAAPKFETKVIRSSVAGAKEGKTAFDAEVHIVDKIDLSSINSRMRPTKQSKAEKEEKQNKKKKNQKAKAETEVTKATPEIKATPEKKEVIVPEKVEEKPVEKIPEKEIEFIETQYQKLEGPKVVSKIDLSQFDKPKTKGHEEEKKKKRKRIKKEGVKIDEISAGNTNKQSDNKQGGEKSAKQQGKDKKSEKNKKNKKEEKKKPEVDDAEIEKQIKETLARLSPMGKSKTSKHNREKRQKVHQHIEEEQLREMENQKTLQVTEFVTANELATMMNIPVTQIISTCMSVGIFVSINQRLDAETIRLIADEFGFDINFASAEVVDTLHKIEEEDRPEDLIIRNPIVTVMGHVDHGKTSLLDYIRKTNVIAGEAGGITQHIGAYEVTTADGRKITFLDTPGHEAFTAMRARGAKVTDIAIIVIAADDKIMPQTIEAINHAQAAGVPIVFAINKIDKPGADPDRIKTELANMNLLVEEWGGKYQSQDISAKKGIGVEELLEKVILQADIMELKGNPNKRAKGTVLESSLDKGRGYVAKILVEDGTIRKGDPVVAGAISGRVRAMYNERNQEVVTAGPSQPVLLLGLTGACQAGDTFNVTENEKEAKDIATRRTQLQRELGLRTQTHMTLDEIGRRIALGNFKELNIIVKADVDGSVEALSDSLLKLSTEEVQVNVIHKAVGQITENDVLLAESSDAVIIGFQVRPSVGARKMAETEHIDIRIYSIIYDAINELKDAIEGMLSPEKQEKITANLEIRETFKISKVGTIAGCMCLDGKINRNSNVRIIRDGIVVYTGKLASLKRFKDDVKEVVSGQDCGLNIENFNDIKVGDIVEAYEVIEIKRKL
ncbi:MAG: translation initiation factor IF-2 [Bacteroidales bacterium]|nr:translation initiation factor IF-2 [Bacteroidales bacterium]